MRPGDQVGPYLVEKALGSGAMGTVYRARHLETGQRVAIKVVAPGLAANTTAMERFKREADILKQLRHPHIVRLVATGRHQGTPFYAMEYVEGESLDRVLARRGRITWEEVVDIGRQLCAALQHAHDKGIVHRDLKPSNLMVLENGVVKLTDFGIAKDLDVTALTGAHCTVGTAAYMSPEQCRGDRDLTYRSDLYSMGVMFYELLTGRKPFQADAPMEMFLLHLNAACERPSRMIFEIPIWLDTIVMQLLEKLPEQRPFNAETVADALNRVREKVEAQQSAGMEAATARVKDRSPHRPRLDEEDREAARTLLGKKKRKKKGEPFYRSRLVQAVGLLAVLAGLGWLFYMVFLKVPSPEALYEEATDLWGRGRQVDARNGPIASYLRHYGHLGDERTKNVHNMADEYDERDTEEAIYARRRSKFAFANDPLYTAATRAIDAENDGRLEAAREEWQKLLKHKTDAENRGWALVAEKYLRDLDRVDPKTRELTQRIEKEDPKAPYQSDDRQEELAVQALRAELQGKAGDAARLWRELKDTREQVDYRRWHHLLAARKLHDQPAAR